MTVLDHLAMRIGYCPKAALDAGRSERQFRALATIWYLLIVNELKDRHVEMQPSRIGAFPRNTGRRYTPQTRFNG